MTPLMSIAVDHLTRELIDHCIEIGDEAEVCIRLNGEPLNIVGFTSNKAFVFIECENSGLEPTGFGEA